MHPDEKGDFLVINSRVVHSVQCPRQCREMLIQIPYPMMKRFIPQIDGLEFVCEKITGKKQRMDTFLVESALSTLAELHPFQSPEETPGVLQPDISSAGCTGKRFQCIGYF